MSKLALLCLFSLVFSVTVLESHTITLENGKVLYMRSVDSSELAHVESIIGCSTRCASACMTFSTGLAAVQCAKHCGCGSLIDSKKSELSIQKLYEADTDIEVYYPRSDSENTEIFIESDEADLRISINETSAGGSTTRVATVNDEDGSSKKDELVIEQTQYGDSEIVVGSIEVRDPQTGDSAGVDGFYYHKEEKNTTTDIAYAGAYETDSNGNSQSVYVQEVDVATEDGNQTVYVKNTTWSDGTYEAERIEVGVVEVNISSGEGSGAGLVGYEWSLSAQALDQTTGWAWYLFLVAVAVVGFVVYKKLSGEAVKRYHATVRPVEESTDYIRI